MIRSHLIELSTTHVLPSFIFLPIVSLYPKLSVRIVLYCIVLLIIIKDLVFYIKSNVVICTIFTRALKYCCSQIIFKENKFLHALHILVFFIFQRRLNACYTLARDMFYIAWLSFPGLLGTCSWIYSTHLYLSVSVNVWLYRMEDFNWIKASMLNGIWDAFYDNRMKANEHSMWRTLMVVVWQSWPVRCSTGTARARRDEGETQLLYHLKIRNSWSLPSIIY